MFDIIHTLRGKHACGWCVDRPTSWFERVVMAGDTGGRTKHWWQELYWRHLLRFPAWKIAQALHYRLHENVSDR